MKVIAVPRENHFIWVRYLAAFSILISHSRLMISFPDYQQITGTLTWLFPGVPTLFLISGFLVSLSNNNSEFNFQYLVKRILRIFPPLWASIILTVIALFVVGYLTPSNLNWGEFVFWFLGQLTVLQVYHPHFLKEFGIGVINGSLWAILVIFQFYMFLPFFTKIDLYLSRKYSNKGLIMILIFFAIINSVFHYFHNFHESIITKILFLTLIPWAFHFFLGYFFQKNFHLIRGEKISSFFFWLTIHLLAYLTLHSFGYNWGRNDINPILLIIFALVIFNAAFLPKSKNKTFNKIEYLLKKYDITFGIFVYHMVVLNFIVHYEVLLNNSLERLVLLIFLTISVSMFSMFFLEKPIRDNRDNILSTVETFWLAITTKK